MFFVQNFAFFFIEEVGARFEAKSWIFSQNSRSVFFSFGYIFKEIASFIHIYVFFLAAGVVFKEIWSKARE